MIVTLVIFFIVCFILEGLLAISNFIFAFTNNSNKKILGLITLIFNMIIMFLLDNFFKPIIGDTMYRISIIMLIISTTGCFINLIRDMKSIN